MYLACLIIIIVMIIIITIIIMIIIIMMNFIVKFNLTCLKPRKNYTVAS